MHRAGQLTEAATYYLSILKAQPANLDAKHLLALVRMQEGRLAEAVRMLRQIAAVAPRLASVQVNLGDALRFSGKPADALSAYVRAITIDPTYAEAHVNRGVVLAQLNRRPEALQAFSAALNIRPAFEVALNNRGTVHQELGQFAEALADFDAALKALPHNPEIQYNRGNCLKAWGKFAAAEQAYRQALKLAPDMVDGWNNLGNVQRQLGEPEAALISFDRALALDPGNVAVHNNRGNALRELGRGEEALAAYGRALDLRPDFAVAHNNLGDTLSELGRFSEARDAFCRAIAHDPAYAHAYLNLSTIHRFAPGDRLIGRMVSGRANTADAADQARFGFALGKAHADIGAHAEAFRFYADAAALRRRLLPYDETATLALISGFKSLVTPEFVARHRGSGDPGPRPIFILGMPRSGTSLVEQIVASHPDIEGGGELPAMNRALQPFVERPGVFPMNLADLGPDDLVAIAGRYAAEVAPRCGTGKRLTDKMPLNFYFLGLIALAMPNARIIHVTRNPVDTCLSCFMQHFTEGNEFTNDLAELGRYWRAYADLMTHWRQVLGPDAFIDIAYEDVVADTERQARRMIDYIGLNWDDRCLAFHQTDRAVRTASVIQVRQPVYRTSVERWRVYEPWIGPLMEALG